MPKQAAHADRREVNNELAYDWAAHPVIVRIGEAHEELIEANVE